MNNKEKLLELYSLIELFTPNKASIKACCNKEVKNKIFFGFDVDIYKEKYESYKANVVATFNRHKLLNFAQIQLSPIELDSLLEGLNKVTTDSFK